MIARSLASVSASGGSRVEPSGPAKSAAIDSRAPSFQRTSNSGWVIARPLIMATTGSSCKGSVQPADSAAEAHNKAKISEKAGRGGRRSMSDRFQGKPLILDWGSELIKEAVCLDLLSWYHRLGGFARLR